MVISSFPAASSSPIKSIQRGAAATSGNITISAVVTAKTQVTSFSTAASGTVSATGALSAANGAVGGFFGGTVTQQGIPSPTGFNVANNSIAMNITNLSGGSTNLTSAAFGVYLSDETTLVASGACRYEVIEYV